jgi:hypothetical protein
MVKVYRPRCIFTIDWKVVESLTIHFQETKGRRVMKTLLTALLAVALTVHVGFAGINGGGQTRKSLGTLRTNPYSSHSLSNTYGAGSPYRTNGLRNPYSQYGSRYSNKSWSNPYANNAPQLYNHRGQYRGRLSTNPYSYDSTSNPYGPYGSPYSPDSINNPYGAGSPYRTNPIYVYPGR